RPPPREPCPRRARRGACGRPRAASRRGNRPLETDQAALLLHHSALLLERPAAGARLRAVDLERAAGAEPHAQTAGEAEPHAVGVERLESPSTAGSDEPPELGAEVAAAKQR